MDLRSDIGKLGALHKGALIFGAIAFFLSLVIGLAAGNTIAYSFGRGFLFGILFTVIGFAVVVLIRKYVPELSGVGSSMGAPVDTSDKLEIIGGSADVSKEPSPESAGIFQGESDDVRVDAAQEEAPLPRFEPLKDHLKSIPGDELDAKGKARLGRHVLQEKSMKYEPKIAAEAIRTLMSRDQ